MKEILACSEVVFKDESAQTALDSALGKEICDYLRNVTDSQSPRKVALRQALEGSKHPNGWALAVDAIVSGVIALNTLP